MALMTTNNFMLNVDNQVHIIYLYKIMVPGYSHFKKKKNQEKMYLKLSPKCGALLDFLYLGPVFQETLFSASRISSGGDWPPTNIHTNILLSTRCS